jgi:bifunctional N-acetylglucosamine-1-phosphate-uridyltransferase/glucosamine-1-phosphate-acetyltransferase GlmU-like protein
MELIGKKMPVQAKIVDDSSEVMGINNINQLSSLEKNK